MTRKTANHSSEVDDEKARDEEFGDDSRRIEGVEEMETRAG